MKTKIEHKPNKTIKLVKFIKLPKIHNIAKIHKFQGYVEFFWERIIEKHLREKFPFLYILSRICIKN